MGPVHPDQHKIDDRVNALSMSYRDDEGFVVVAGRIGGPRATVKRFTHDPDRPTHLDLRRFAEWRTSKCLPRNLELIGDRLAELDQGTLELCGETGEIAELILAQGENEGAIFDPAFRAKVIDECGDVLFCASWLADAWGANPLRTLPKLGETLDAVCRTIQKSDRNLATMGRMALMMNAQSGLLANSAKKVLCQGRSQDVEPQFRRVSGVLDATAIILGIIGASVYDAAYRNIEKLDSRYPEGHELGQGGGIRTGKGA